MNFSTPSSPKPTEPKSILLIGPGGGGKTTLIMQFPKVAFFDVDRNLDGPRAYITKHSKSEPTFGYDEAWIDEDGKSLAMNECFDNLLRKMKSFKDQQEKLPLAERVKFIAVDGITIAGEAVKQKLFKKLSRDAMETRDWDPYKTDLIKLIIVRLREFNHIGINTIATCHEDPVTKADKANIMVPTLVSIDPKIQGGLQNGLSGLFTDVWRVIRQPDIGDATEQVITTHPTTLQNYLKNSMNMPAKITIADGELAWKKLEPYLKGCV